MSNLQKVVDDPKTRAKMKKSFHLKIYVGVFDSYVELFSGSFNVQKNSTIENMALRRLGKNQFKKNYMDVMVDKYSYRIPQEEKALFVNIDLNDNISSKVLNLKDINQILANMVGLFSSWEDLVSNSLWISTKALFTSSILALFFK